MRQGGHRLPACPTPGELVDRRVVGAVRALSEDPTVDGILVQHPVPVGRSTSGRCSRPSTREGRRRGDHALLRGPWPSGCRLRILHPGRDRPAARRLRGRARRQAGGGHRAKSDPGQADGHVAAGAQRHGHLLPLAHPAAAGHRGPRTSSWPRSVAAVRARANGSSRAPWSSTPATTMATSGTWPSTRRKESQPRHTGARRSRSMTIAVLLHQTVVVPNGFTPATTGP